MPVQPGASGGLKWNDSVSTGELYLISSSESHALITATEARERAAIHAVDDNKPDSQK